MSFLFPDDFQSLLGLRFHEDLEQPFAHEQVFVLYGSLASIIALCQINWLCVRIFGCHNSPIDSIT